VAACACRANMGARTRVIAAPDPMMRRPNMGLLPIAGSATTSWDSVAAVGARQYRSMQTGARHL
jgi:hypothetical protein